VILTCDRYPKEVDGLEERLKSRFGWGLTVAIEPPELETCVAILMSKAAMTHVDLPEEVAFFIAKRIRSKRSRIGRRASPRRCDFQFYRETDYAGSRQGGVAGSVGVAGKNWSRLKIFRRPWPSTTKSGLQICCQNVAAVQSPGPRQVAMALAKELTNHSLPEIGDAFGGRDHTTVLHACRRVKGVTRDGTSHWRDYLNLLRTLAG